MLVKYYYDMINKKFQHIDYHLLSDEIDKLQLDLKGNPVFDHLAVFIKDPANPEQYWFRKLYAPIQPDTDDFIYEDHPMDDFNSIPCGKQDLEFAVRSMIGYQIDASRSPSEAVRKQQAQVGVAEYIGEDTPLLDRVIPLTVAKYNNVRQEWMDSQEWIDC